MYIIISFIVMLTLSSATKPNRTEEHPDVLESWIKLDKTLKGATQSVIKYLMPMLMESSSQVNLSSTCIKQGLHLVTGLRSLKKWAFSFVDSSAKSFDGLLSGALSSFGEYDQCLETIVFDRRKKDEVLYQGQYCMVQLRLPLPPKTKRYRLFDQLEELKNFSGTEVMKHMSQRAHLMHYIPIRIGLCIPSGCNEDDLQSILNFAAKKFDMDAQVSYCEMKEEKQFCWVQIFAIVIICCLMFLVIAGTWMETHSNPESVRSDKLCDRILLSFSAISNFKRLFNTETSMECFSCIHGLRFLTITWVVYGHSYLFPGLLVGNYRSLFRIPETSTEPVVQMIINGSEAVDTFLFIAGLLVSYMTIKRVKLEKKKFNYLIFAIHRFWRIAPVVYFVLLCSFLIPLMGSGPVFQEIMENSVYPCFQQWWRNMLFINNFFDSYKSCWRLTWYVSCDIQLYLISVIVVLPMIWYKKMGIMINTLIVAASIIYTGIVTYIFDISPTILVTHMNPDDEYFFFVYSYANTLCRAGPYFIGVFTGYILITKPAIKISKKFQIIGWCFATLSSGLVIFATAIWYRVHSPTPLEGLLYSATYKVAFTAGVAWMTFCCIAGYGGFINTFLSWKVWIPLGRLAFLTYLIQPVFQMSYMANFRTTQEFTHLHFAMQYFGFLCISMLLAFVANLLVESPFLSLEKIFFESNPRTEEKLKMDGHENVGFENGDMTLKVNGQVEMLTCENGTTNMESYKNTLNEKSEL